MKKKVRVANVNLTWGIIGILGDSPQRKLNKAVTKYSNDGWRVQQILPAQISNALLTLFRLGILILTLGLWAPAEGYYLLLEKNEQN